MKTFARLPAHGILVIALAHLLLAACAAVPPSHVDVLRQQATFDDGASRVRDAPLDARLTGIVDRLEQTNADIGKRAIGVHVLRDPLPDIQSLSNGTIYVSTGLIARLDDEDQLASIIAAQVAGWVRGDDQTLDRLMRERAAAEALPTIIAVTATAGLAVNAINEGTAQNRELLRRKLQTASDAVALHWLQLSGYDPQQAPRGLERLLGSLTREHRFGSGDLDSAEALNTRIESFKGARLAVPALASQPAAQARTESGRPAPWWRATSRQFALEIAQDDLDNGRSTALAGLLDTIDSADGATGATAYLRARDLQMRHPESDYARRVIAAYEHCTTYPDTPATVFRELGVLHRRLGDRAAARADFERYLKVAPSSVDAPIIRDYLKASE